MSQPLLLSQSSAATGSDESFVSPTKIFSVLGRNKLLAGSVALATFLCCAAVIVTLKPFYETDAEIMVGTRGMISPSQTRAFSDQAVDLVGLNTQIGVLKSPAIARMVVQSLHLTENPEYLQTLAPGAVAKLKQKLGLQHAAAPLTAAQRESLFTGILISKIRIANDGRSAIIDIAARANSAELSTRIANAYANAYFVFEQQAKIDAARRASAMLEEQISPLRDRALNAERMVSQYREENNLNLLGADDSLSGDRDNHSSLPMTSNGLQLTQMSHELGEAEADLASKQSIASQAEAAAARGNGAALSAITGSPLIQGLQLQQAQINARISTLSASALGNNPELIAARAEGARLSGQIATESHKLVQGLKVEEATAQARVNTLKAQTDTLQATATTETHADIHLRQLVSEANAAQAVYRDYLSRLSQISAETSMQQAEARLIAPAVLPLGPSGPPKKQYLVLAALIAAGLGVGAALLRDRSSLSARTLTELHQRTHLFGLGVLPRFSGTLHQQLEDGTSLYGQMLSSIRNILTFGHQSNRTRVMVVTSAESDEGKTTLAVSLAASMGARGKRALVIDCDAHHPSVLRTAGYRGVPSAELVQDVLPGVDVYVPETQGGHGALNFSALSEFIEKRAGSYDKIIIDTPPVLGFPEAGILAGFAEGVILAVKWQSTHTSTVVEAHNVLKTYQAHCLGAVLTCVQIEHLKAREGSRMGVYGRNPLLNAPRR